MANRTEKINKITVTAAKKCALNIPLSE